MIDVSKNRRFGVESFLAAILGRATDLIGWADSRGESRAVRHIRARAAGMVGGERDLASDLAEALKAIVRREYPRAEELLERVLDSDPDCARAHALAGVLRERRGQSHAAYHSYKRAILIDSNCPLALVGVRRYCEIMGFDGRNSRLNPSASRREVES